MIFMASKKAQDQIVALYEARISDLHSQISDLRRIALPPVSHSIPAVALEADAILTGRDETYDPTPSPLTDEEMRKVIDEISERDRILSGTYGEAS